MPAPDLSEEQVEAMAALLNPFAFKSATAIFEDIWPSVRTLTGAREDEVRAYAQRSHDERADSRQAAVLLARSVYAASPGPAALAEVERLREALESILCCHDGNPPDALGAVSDVEYARRTISTMHRIARAALEADHG